MTDAFSRQSFLGESTQSIIEATSVGLVGLGGGGSHIAQQLAHVGFLKYCLVDPDRIEESNLNRLVGGTADAVTANQLKVQIGANLICGIRPRAVVGKFQTRWQESTDALARCDIIFGAIDGFDERRQLESFARRHLIPLIDVGMDVVTVPPDPPQMAGQLILSMPGFACMTCMGFLNDKSLSAEAARYGDAGPAPQVVWANGLLASAAVGIAVDLITDWTKSLRAPLYLTYRGNVPSLSSHARTPYLDMKICPHFPLEDIGPPKFNRL